MWFWWEVRQLEALPPFYLFKLKKLLFFSAFLPVKKFIFDFSDKHST